MSAWEPQEYYGGDAVETEQDALDEEIEAKRLQLEHLQGMTEADFGFEHEWNDDDESTIAPKAVVIEKLPQLRITPDMGAEKRLELLHSRYPEFDRLAKEFLDLQGAHNQLAIACGKDRSPSPPAPVKGDGAAPAGNSIRNPIAMAKYQALSAYLACLAMYFAILTSPKKKSGQDGIAIAPQDLRSHPLMDHLLRTRELWSRVQDLDEVYDAVPASSDDADMLHAPNKDHKDEVDIVPGPVDKERKRKRSKNQRAAESAAAKAESQRQERIRKARDDLAGLVSLLDKPSTKAELATKPVALIDSDDSDFGEETGLTAEEATEKARKKKTLRFYTSQITQKANMRGAKSRTAGGDDDVPHRERLRDRQAKLNELAEKRGKKRKDSNDELGGHSDDDVDAGKSNDDGYYDFVATQAQKKKAVKKEREVAYATAQSQNGRVIEVEEIGPDNKRKITYAIEKNKGLTPFRKKDVRNPRVRKRRKYEEKKKKLGSIRAIYKGGEGKGGYRGEITGIKSNLVRSVKL